MLYAKSRVETPKSYAIYMFPKDKGKQSCLAYVIPRKEREWQSLEGRRVKQVCYCLQEWACYCERCWKVLLLVRHVSRSILKCPIGIARTLGIAQYFSFSVIICYCDRLNTVNGYFNDTHVQP